MSASLILIGLGAGATSALLSVAVASGSPLGLFLAQIAPLPILIAGLGWRHLAGLVAVFAAALLLAVGAAPLIGLIFVASIGLPSWWLAYLALLARQDGPAAQAEWYPVGRLLIWAAMLGAVLTAVTLLTISTDLDVLRTALRAFFIKAFEGSGFRADQLPAGEDPKKLADVFAAALPIVAATLSTIFWVTNLWLAARICRASGRLVRPWPELARTELPRGAALGLGAGMLASFLPGMPGLIAEMFVATLLTAFMLIGLAVMHVTTRAAPARALILFGFYAVLIILPWLVVFVAGLGVAEQLFGIRRRFGPPPGGPPTAAANLP